MKKIPKEGCTVEFKDQAVKDAQAVGIVVAAEGDGEPGLAGEEVRGDHRGAWVPLLNLKLDLDLNFSMRQSAHRG